ncbi:MAG: hypothetical protein WAO00_12380 [Chthoniobacterales bacterium]
MHKVSFKANQATTNNKVSVTAEFSDDDFRCLEAYRTYVDDLLSVKLVQDGIPCSVNLDYEQGVGTTVTSQLPPDDEIMAMLHRLRPLILTNEHASFNRVCGILGARISEPMVRQAIKALRQVYDGRRMQEQIVIQATADNSEMIINSEAALFTWLNAYEYHRDQNKKEEIDRFHQLLPLIHSKAFFLMLISDKVRALVTITRFVNVVLGKTESSWI